MPIKEAETAVKQVGDPQDDFNIIIHHSLDKLLPLWFRLKPNQVAMLSYTGWACGDLFSKGVGSATTNGAGR